MWENSWYLVRKSMLLHLFNESISFRWHRFMRHEKQEPEPALPTMAPSRPLATPAAVLGVLRVGPREPQEEGLQGLLAGVDGVECLCLAMGSDESDRGWYPPPQVDRKGGGGSCCTGWLEEGREPRWCAQYKNRERGAENEITRFIQSKGMGAGHGVQFRHAWNKMLRWVHCNLCAFPIADIQNDKLPIDIIIMLKTGTQKSKLCKQQSRIFHNHE